jgi:hypothetical protein
MKFFKSDTVALVLLLVIPLAITVRTQGPPPVRGTVALEGSMKKFYRAAGTIIVATIDGVEHVYHFTKNLVVHGGHGPGVDALEGLREGSTVVVHYTTDGNEQAAREVDVVGGEGLGVTEGIVTRIDRRRKQITVRYDNGTVETFLLTEHAAAETPNDVDRPGTRVVIYYSDQAGHRVAHFFRKTS